jgi:hypothetical protein
LSTITAKRWKARLLPAVLIAGFVTWMTAVCVSIANEPPEGAGSLKELRSNVGAAVHGQDADRLQNLFDKDTVSDDYAENLLRRLKDDQAVESAAPVVEEAQGKQLLVLKGTGAGGAMCVPWLAAEDDGRWYLDGTPPLRAAVCDGS